MRSWLLVLLLVAGALSAEEETPAEEEEEILHAGRVIRQILFPGEVGQGGGGNVRQPGACNCRPIVTCAAELHQITESCALDTGVQGVCCPQRFLASIDPPKGTGDNRIFTSSRKNVPMNPLDIGLVNKAGEKAIHTVNDKKSIEDVLTRNNIVIPRGSPAAGHLRVFKIKNSAKQQDENALTMVLASKNMLNDFSLTGDQGGHGLRTSVRTSNTILSNRCPVLPTCSNPNSKYRIVDGSCNHLRNPAWGRSVTPVQRIALPMYDDGVMEARLTGSTGSPLPNVRVIANNILTDIDNPDPQYTSSVMQWAQFLDHDFIHIPFPTMGNGEGINCCKNGEVATGNDRHLKCLPIDVSGDAFFTPRGSNCMNFVRSMLGLLPGKDCSYGYAEQLNQVTHWLDGSNVYGSDEEEERECRSFRNGLLRSSGNNLLPVNPDQGGDCVAGGKNAQCYLAGDSRVNEQPGLTAMHTVWVREHNRVAKEIQNFNPTWSDEAIYQETRRIVVAEMQHITYNEWLPIIVGPNFMQSFGISTRVNGFSFDYNPNINPTISNEFATAAFRFGHTLVQGNLRLFSASGAESTIQLRNHFNSPHFIQQTPGGLDMIIRSWSRLAIQKYDSFITRELTNHLFQTATTNFGMDLMSLNIQRGRDHGIATYNTMRQICGLPKANNFNDIKDQIPSQIADKLARLYTHVDDIDFFVGGITEKPVSGGLLGWTFLCVVGDQFARLKKGDRYFYDLGGQAGSFSEPQLQEIRRTSWARIMCDNSDNLQQVQPLAFWQSNNKYNQFVSCSSPQIPRMNLQLWRGERPGV